MGPDVMVNVASVGRMFTTIAVLQSLARQPSGHRQPDLAVPAPELGQGPGVDTITSRELLTHRAGFRLDSGLVFATGQRGKGTDQARCPAAGQASSGLYNIDFTIFRDMLPFMEGVRDPGPTARAAAATRFFLAYAQRQVFDPAGVTDDRCAPVRHAMLMYPPPYAGTGPGRRPPVGPSACSAGGWFMTPASMLRVLYGLISGNRLLSGRQRQLMDGNCLGWDCSVAGQASYRGKYGGIGGPDSAGLQTFFGILAGTVPAVIATNSTGSPLQAVVRTALHAAASPR